MFLPSFLITDTFLSYQTLQQLHETGAVTPKIRKVRSPETSQHSFTARRRISKEGQLIINMVENDSILSVRARVFSVRCAPLWVYPNTTDDLSFRSAQVGMHMDGCTCIRTFPSAGVEWYEYRQDLGQVMACPYGRLLVSVARGIA
jgi:hypothetical protein